MKQISTGAGLLGLGFCMLGTAVIATHRGVSEAFAQATGGDRRIVSASVYAVPNDNSYNGGYFSAAHYAYRIWSDNSVDVRCLGWSQFNANGNMNGQYGPQSDFAAPMFGNLLGWRTVDNGTSGFRPLTDVDMSGEVDGGDISQVLLDMNTQSDDLPPPPIDCTINAPR